MTRLLALRGSLAALMVGAALAWTGPALAATAPPEPMTPPPGIDAAHPTVSGTLVAKPNGENNGAPCTSTNAPTTGVQVNRGLVICTDHGKLVLLELQRSTVIGARYWGRIGIGRLTVGDHLSAWGTLRDNGQLLNPTNAVQDIDVQRANTDSQDYISARHNRVLTLMVLKSDQGGPVKGIVRAVPGGKPTNVTLCNGTAGTWADLTPGRTVNISSSLFNRRTNTYIQTVNVQIVC